MNETTEIKIQNAKQFVDRLYYYYSFRFPLGNFRRGFQNSLPTHLTDLQQKTSVQIIERPFFRRASIALSFLLIQSIGITIAITWSISIPFIVDDFLIGWLIPTLPEPLRDLGEAIHNAINSLLSPFNEIWEFLNGIAKFFSGFSPFCIFPFFLAGLYRVVGTEEETEVSEEYFSDWKDLSGANQMDFLKEVMVMQGLAENLFLPFILTVTYLFSVLFFLRRTRKLVFEINRDAPLTQGHKSIEKTITRFSPECTVEFQHNQKSIPRPIKWLSGYSFLPAVFVIVLVSLIIVIL